MLSSMECLFRRYCACFDWIIWIGISSVTGISFQVPLSGSSSISHISLDYSFSTRFWAGSISYFSVFLRLAYTFSRNIWFTWASSSRFSSFNSLDFFVFLFYFFARVFTSCMVYYSTCGLRMSVPSSAQDFERLQDCSRRELIAEDWVFEAPFMSMFHCRFFFVFLFFGLVGGSCSFISFGDLVGCRCIARFMSIRTLICCYLISSSVYSLDSTSFHELQHFWPIK